MLEWGPSYIAGLTALSQLRPGFPRVLAWVSSTRTDAWSWRIAHFLAVMCLFIELIVETHLKLNSDQWSWVRTKGYCNDQRNILISFKTYIHPGSEPGSELYNQRIKNYLRFIYLKQQIKICRTVSKNMWKTYY